MGRLEQTPGKQGRNNWFFYQGLFFSVAPPSYPHRNLIHACIGPLAGSLHARNSAQASCSRCIVFFFCAFFFFCPVPFFFFASAIAHIMMEGKGEGEILYCGKPHILILGSELWRWSLFSLCVCIELGRTALVGIVTKVQCRYDLGRRVGTVGIRFRMAAPLE